MEMAADHRWQGMAMQTYEIEERLIGETRNTHVRVVQGTDVEIAVGKLQVWDSSSVPRGEPHRLVASVALERLVSFKARGHAVINWDGVERRNRPIPIWDGVERRAS
jgi:hypothetical protein